MPAIPVFLQSPKVIPASVVGGGEHKVSCSCIWVGGKPFHSQIIEPQNKSTNVTYIRSEVPIVCGREEGAINYWVICYFYIQTQKKGFACLLKIVIQPCIPCIGWVIRENTSKDNTVNIKAYLQDQEESGSGVDLRSIFPPAELYVHTQRPVRGVLLSRGSRKGEVERYQGSPSLPGVVGNKLCGKCQFSEFLLSVWFSVSETESLSATIKSVSETQKSLASNNTD